MRKIGLPYQNGIWERFNQEKGFVFLMNCNSKQAMKIDHIKNEFWREVITTYLDTKFPILLEELMRGMSQTYFFLTIFS